MTAYEAAKGEKPNIANLQIFGTKCYVSDLSKPKLEPRGKRAVFVDYDWTSPAYNVYFPETKKVARVRAVTFTNSFYYKIVTCEDGPSEEEDEEFMVLSSVGEMQQDVERQQVQQEVQLRRSERTSK